MSVNKVFLIGNLGKDPESRLTAGGDAVTTFTIATSEVYKDKAGVKQEKTEWHRLVLFRKLAEIARDYLRKGTQVYVEGKICTRKWQDKEGGQHYTTEVEVDELRILSKKGSDGGYTGKNESDQDIPFGAELDKKSVLQTDDGPYPF